eukprot:CAMPEP_0201674508 /NCGR_PEP_ID=MMETSP0494-20130426/37271_1 /ASSEMBLY_ACC=CAM_ASM_000839 /TAXON_ID=420259 /ORGANISM="Thalassiosira gravida, Strain GMp14c1" /LENGTH=516 /DNA_ID=CAMNT_0048156675 /DNA_START=316 /DNA_END=1866 /DNA_ORIENTATION=+
MMSDGSSVGGNRIQSPPSQTAASPPSSAAASAVSSSLRKPAKSYVVNPYIREIPHHSIEMDPKMIKKKQFAEKYRAQAIHHSHKSRRNSRSISGGGPAVSSVSALDLVRLSRQWRHSWQHNSCNSDECQVLRGTLNGMPLRPRLFFFHQYGHADQRRQQLQQLQVQYNSQDYSNEGFNKETESRSMSQHHQQVGTWELGTGITELAGEGGSGKTQICLSLCVTCVLTPLLFPREGGGNDSSATYNTINTQEVHNNYYTAIYITMGEGIPSGVIAKRLDKMVHARQNRDDRKERKEILSRIGLLSMRNEDEFFEFVEQDLPNLLDSQNHDTHQNRGHRHHRATKIGLIAFDGIAGFFRFSDPLFQRSQNPMFHRQRGTKLLQISSQLRKLSDVYDVPMLITNQVTACIPPTAGGSSLVASSLSSTSEQVVPALGLLWSNCVSARIILLRKDGMTVTVPDRNGSHDNQDRLKDVNENNRKKGTKVMRARKARALQSVNMPEEREVWFVIDTGEVAAVA